MNLEVVHICLLVNLKSLRFKMLAEPYETLIIYYLRWIWICESRDLLIKESPLVFNPILSAQFTEDNFTVLAAVREVIFTSVGESKSIL